MVVVDWVDLVVVELDLNFPNLVNKVVLPLAYVGIATGKLEISLVLQESKNFQLEIETSSHSLTPSSPFEVISISYRADTVFLKGRKFSRCL